MAKKNATHFSTFSLYPHTQVSKIVWANNETLKQDSRVRGNDDSIKKNKCKKNYNAENLLKQTRELHLALFAEVDLEKVATHPDKELHVYLSDKINNIIQKKEIKLNQAEKDKLITGIFNEIFGFGPLEELLHDDLIGDILVNDYDCIYIDRQGELSKTDIKFYDQQHLMHFISRIADKIGRRVDKSIPYADLRMDDGSRVNVIIPPLAVDGPKISIRRFPKQAITLSDMAASGSISKKMAQLLEIAAKCRLNIIVSGPTSAGKTTLLNAISAYIPANERIITIEDIAELKLQQPHVVRLETRLANVEGKGEIREDILLTNALRMRPNRIILGDLRGSGALNVLHAMNTGHDGSMTTLHANSVKDALSRLTNMIISSGYPFTIDTLNQQIADTVDLIIYANRLPSGKRCVMEISDLAFSKNGKVEYFSLMQFKTNRFIVKKNMGKPSFWHKLVLYGQEKNFKKLF